MPDSKVILLIDDSEDDREYYTQLLTRSKAGKKYHTLEADSGDEGLELLTTRQADCILLDYSLPGQDGLAVLQEIQKSWPYIPVIILTGEGNEFVAVESMKAGAQDYLVKSKIAKSALIRAINNAIDRASLQHKIDEQRQELVMFGHMLAHDLKSPTRSIRSLLSFIKEDTQGQIQGKPLEYMDMITGLTNRIDRLIDALSAYTKLNREPEKPHIVSMQQIIEAAQTNLHQDILEKNAEVHCGALPLVEGHGEHLIQLLQNLIGNAIKYCEVSPLVNITCEQRDDEFIFSIQDNGIGIDQEYLEYVFEPFKRLHSKDKYEGSGIGLATCKKIVQRHSGQIWCQSEPGVGTTFMFSLPASAQLMTEIAETQHKAD